MENAMIIAVLVIILGAAGGYLYRAKKKGKTCIGCPYSGCKGGCPCQHNDS